MNKNTISLFFILTFQSTNKIEFFNELFYNSINQKN